MTDVCISSAQYEHPILYDLPLNYNCRQIMHADRNYFFAGKSCSDQLHFTWSLPAHQAPRILHPLSPTPHISACAGPHIKGEQSLVTAIGNL